MKLVWFLITVILGTILIGTLFATFVLAGNKNACEAPPIKEIPLPEKKAPVNTSGGGTEDGRRDGGYTTWYFPPVVQEHPQETPPRCTPVENLTVQGKTLTWTGTPPFYVRYGIHKLNLPYTFTTYGTSYVSPGRYWFAIINACGIQLIDP